MYVVYLVFTEDGQIDGAYSQRFIAQKHADGIRGYVQEEEILDRVSN